LPDQPFHAARLDQSLNLFALTLGPLKQP
jgi:hypothetical protein